MRIWIDGYEANVPQRLGSSQVAFELLKNIEKLDEINDYTILLSSPPLDDFPQERDGWRYKILKINKFKTYLAIPLSLLTTKNKPDLFFSPTHYIPRFSKVKRVVTIFDLAFLRYPEMFNKKDLWQLKNWSKYSIENAKHIITISNASKSDIAKSYHIDNKKITVAYPGFNAEIFKVINDQDKISEACKKYGIEGNYVIYIGTIQPRKNLTRLIEAFSRVILSDQRRISNMSRDSSATPQNDNLQLVIVGKTTGEGKQGWKFEDILDRPKQLGIASSVIFTGFVPEEEVAFLINGSKAFILPSLWEGFGIPLAEAMACGVPVITSNVSSLPEVVGKAGLLINPNSQDQIEQAIRVILSDQKLSKKLSQAGLIQAKKFSWKKMAKIVLRVFKEVDKG